MDQLLDLSLDPAPAGTVTGLRAIELTGNKFAVPIQDSVRPGYGGDVDENFAAQPICTFMMRFSAARYSFRASSSWSTVPVT
jgi:hypothetical protein